MTTTTFDDDLPLAPLNGAQRPFLELYGSALTLNTYLKILVALLLVVCLGLLVQMARIQTQYAHLTPLVIRIHEDGRTSLETYDQASTYTPQVYEVRYFLRHFVQEFYSRQRPSLRKDYTHALYFIAEPYRQTIAPDLTVRQVLDTFRQTPTADDVEVTVDNIVLSELKAPPYQAAVYFTRQAYQAGTRTKRGAAQQFDLQVEFSIDAHPPEWMRQVNPLALEITHLSELFRDFQMSAGLTDVLPFIRPLAPLILDPTVTDVLVNHGGRRVYVERHGRLEQALGLHLTSDYLHVAITTIAHMCGMPVGPDRPLLEARLDDGSRVTATLPPCAPEGDLLTIRKFCERYTLPQLVEAGTLSDALAATLREAVLAQQNVLISGGTGTGKTTILNALARFVPVYDRLLLIEDTSEVFIPDEYHVARFEAQKAKAAIPESGVVAVPAVTVGDLLEHVLRHRPDRIIVGEVRRNESWDLLQALNTGHQGSMTTIHANSALQALNRLAQLVTAIPGFSVPIATVYEMIGLAIHLVVHIDRNRQTGQRTVTEVLALRGFNALTHTFDAQTIHPKEPQQ